MRDEDILAAARAMQAETAALLTAAGMTGPLDAFLDRAARGESVADEILALLTTEPRTREEVRRRLPVEDDTSRGIDAAPGGRWEQPGSANLPGREEPSAEIVFRCQRCGYEYPIFEVGEPVPDSCPHGHGPLLQVQ